MIAMLSPQWVGGRMRITVLIDCFHGLTACRPQDESKGGCFGLSPTKKARFFIDSSAQLWYNRNMENTHKCGACEDNGFIDEQETVYCDCPSGDLMADIDAEFRAEEEAEARGTDYAYAVDSQGDDSPPSDWY